MRSSHHVRSRRQGRAASPAKTNKNAAGVQESSTSSVRPSIKIFEPRCCMPCASHVHDVGYRRVCIVNCEEQFAKCIHIFILSDIKCHCVARGAVWDSGNALILLPACNLKLFLLSVVLCCGWWRSLWSHVLFVMCCVVVAVVVVVVLCCAS
jgi:hypothetical protein